MDKKYAEYKFDINMGSYNRTCKLIGIYILKISRITEKINTGLYRDDG